MTSEINILKSRLSDTKDQIIPTEKNIVILLFKFIREEAREVASKNGTLSKQYIIYTCPKTDNCINSNSEIAFQKGKGFTNPCNHLKTYLARDSLEQSHNTCSMNVERNQNQFTILFHPVINITMKERELIDWVKLIIEENLLVGVVKKRSYRTFKDRFVMRCRQPDVELFYMMVGQRMACIMSSFMPTLRERLTIIATKQSQRHTIRNSSYQRARQ